jgi:hypothetical protein
LGSGAQYKDVQTSLPQCTAQMVPATVEPPLPTVEPPLPVRSPRARCLIVDKHLLGKDSSTHHINFAEIEKFASLIQAGGAVTMT